MSIEIIISVIGIGLTLPTLLIVYRQLVAELQANRSTIMVSLIEPFYFDHDVQRVLSYIYGQQLNIDVNASAHSAIIHLKEGTDISLEIDMLLNRMQVIGHLYAIGVLHTADLRGIRFEIISVGRDEAIRKYFHYCNTTLKERTNIVHDHFSDFKRMYMCLEYDANQRRLFKRYLFDYPSGIGNA